MLLGQSGVQATESFRKLLKANLEEQPFHALR